MLRIVAGAAVLLVGGLLMIGLWPIVDRNAPATDPRPMPQAIMGAAPAIAHFAEKEARGIDAMIIHRNGEVAAIWGAVDVPMNLASARKSVLSLLFGIAQARGVVDLDATLGGLGIDETRTPLSDVEKSATVRHLLMSRSGVYLPAAGETQRARDLRPERGTHTPGAEFYYNNWSFNVLGAIFERQTSMTIGAAVDAWLAVPLGMEDFHPSHAFFDRSASASDFPAYRIHMSARDLARLGTLVLNNGQWAGETVVDSDWIEQSLTVYSIAGPPMAEPPYGGYGYSWWLNAKTGDAIASGWGGQFLFVDRLNAMVLVVRRDTGNSLLGHFWFSRFSRRGSAWDLPAIRELALGG